MIRPDVIVSAIDRHMQAGASSETILYGIITALGVDYMDYRKLLDRTPKSFSMGNLDENRAIDICDELITKFHVTPREQLESLLGEAFKVYQASLMSCNENIRNKAAVDVMDRVLGKPTQSLEVKSLSLTGDIKDLKMLDGDLQATLKRLEKMKAARALLPSQTVGRTNDTRAN